MNALVLFDSMGGNTEKVAGAIHEAIEKEQILCHMIKLDKETDLDFYDYDLIFIGSPVIDWLPTKTMMEFVKTKLKEYNGKGMIRPSAPIIPGKFAICFGTFAGPHIGKREALPMTMWLRSFLEHIGFMVLDTWHIVGQFKDRDDLNINGRLGNIQNRPNENDLENVKNRVEGILASLEAWK
ncbi:flavodoxin family protein [Desulfonema magnum]|uniref:Flavodoxin domain-containing protein n=1 Tax=Desulfonema magnum TaxID=45655 RepID=A0A975BPS5_9BACT|nr:flavodoxin family protein [Desulfonema magnum]QTA89118.1 Flavodoxin domain-containing protein [Desulfonema magnum]